MRTVAGLDIGATTVRAAIADERGQFLSTITEPTPGDHEAVVDVIQGSLVAGAESAGITLDAVAAVGIGSMGPLDHDVATGNAAEMGHVTVAPDSDQRCGCGDTGHWEPLCSGRAIPETARTIAAETELETRLDLSDLS